jgi:hypothetical protein
LQPLLDEVGGNAITSPKENTAEPILLRKHNPPNTVARFTTVLANNPDIEELMHLSAEQDDIEKSNNYVRFGLMVDKSDLNELVALSDNNPNLTQWKSESSLTTNRPPPLPPKPRNLAKDKESLEIDQAEIPAPKNPNLPWKLKISKSEAFISMKKGDIVKPLPELPRKPSLSPMIKRKLNQIFANPHSIKKPLPSENDAVPASPLRYVVTAEQLKSGKPTEVKKQTIPTIDITTPSRFDLPKTEDSSPCSSIRSDEIKGKSN